jgi:hypothetical protein
VDDLAVAACLGLPIALPLILLIAAYGLSQWLARHG